MTTFDDLFGDMGPAYSAIVQAHLKIKADAGNQLAATILTDLQPHQNPQPGDVVFADGTFWTWDSSDGEDYIWWSAARRAGLPSEDLDGPMAEVEIERIIWHGQLVTHTTPAPVPEMPDAAIELFHAVQWALATHHLCMQEENERTKAKYYRRLGIDNVSDLVDMYREAPIAGES